MLFIYNMVLQNPVIPVNYSRFAYLTNLFLLRLSIVSYRKQEYVLSIIVALLYFASNLHWTYLKSGGLIRRFDKTMVYSTFIWAFIRAFFYDCSGIYYRISMINIAVFILNEYANKKTIYNEKYIVNEPNSKLQLQYLRACIIHMLALHIIQPETGSQLLERCSIME